METKKQKKAQYLTRLSPQHEELIIAGLKEEWDNAEKALKKHELIERAKHAGVAVGKTLLGLGLLAGVITIAAVAPNVFAVAGMFGNRRRFVATEHLSKQLRRGSSCKYWSYSKIAPDKYRIELTAYGRQCALRNGLRDFKLRVRPQWDGKWRIAMFDIPRKANVSRDAFRSKLHSMGMYPLQESVFVYPYPCFDEVAMWAELFRIEAGIKTAEAIFSPNQNKELKAIFHIL